MKNRVRQSVAVGCMFLFLLVTAMYQQNTRPIAEVPVVVITGETIASLKITKMANIATVEAKTMARVRSASEGTVYPIENGNTKKTYLPYKAFAEWSNQYALQQMAETNEYGLRVVDGRYCVAVGTYFGMEIGQLFDIELENGTIIPCVMGDEKADKHTDEQNLFTVHSDCMAEFIVYTKELPTMARRMGNVSYAVDGWNSKIVSVTVYDENILNPS